MIQMMTQNLRLTIVIVIRKSAEVKQVVGIISDLTSIFMLHRKFNQI